MVTHEHNPQTSQSDTAYMSSVALFSKQSEAQVPTLVESVARLTVLSLFPAGAGRRSSGCCVVAVDGCEVLVMGESGLG